MRSRQVPVPQGTAIKVADGPLSKLVLTTNGPVYLGASSVTVGNGFLWEGGDLKPLEIPLMLLESLWATTTSPGVVVFVLEPGLL